MRIKFCELIYVTIPVIFVDQLSKYIATAKFGDVIVYNSGISFGLGRVINPYVILMFIIIVVLLMTVFISRQIYENNLTTWQVIGAGLILGGALGNLSDRIFRGAVVDFIDFPNLWPNYNIADIAISIGVFLVLLTLIYDKKG